MYAKKICLSVSISLPLGEVPPNQNPRQKAIKTQMQKTLEGKEDEQEGTALSIWDCGSPLYDSYELVSFSHVIDRHLMALPHLGGSKHFISRFSHANNAVTSMESNAPRGKLKGSAMVATSLDKFDVIRKTWNGKMIMGSGREENPEKKKTWLPALFKRIGLWRKQKHM